MSGLKLVAAAALVALSSVPTVQAWGAMGHETIAYIASNFVESSTESYFQSLLGDSTADYLANVAAWADTYRYTSAGAYSKPYHFIDANDSPPSSCSVELDRDCGDGKCVVTAIANYTSHLISSKVSKANRVIAAKMVIHFVGDIGQPLHCENLDVGGNDIDVTYNGASTNLHHIWDTEILTAIAGGDDQSTAQTWANTLTNQITSGTYKSSAAGWVSGLDINSAQDVALGWAQESNGYVCSNVLKKGLTYVEDTDLGGSYTTTATPVVDLQIAKQGYRLAKWLDAIAAVGP